MAAILAWLIGGILFLVSGVHFYWMLGGTIGGLAAIPSEGAEPLFQPSKPATGTVAVLLAVAGWLVLELGDVVPSPLLSEGLLNAGGGLLAAVFILRAIGEFRWVGFSKKQKGTLFAKWDTLLYSPLCLLLGTGVLVMLLV